MLWVVIIFGSGYYLSTVSGYTNLLILLPILMIVSGLIDAYLLRKELRVYKNHLILLPIFLLPIFVQSLLNLEFGFSELKYIVIIIFCYYITRTIDYETFLKQFVNVMAFISISAILGYFVLCFTPLSNFFPTVLNYNNYTYYSGLLFSGISYQAGVVHDRLQGLFWEPGVFATYITLALFFIKKEHYKTTFFYVSTVVLFIITLILTQSGAGILMLILILVIKLFRERQISNRIVLTVTCLIIALIPLLSDLAIGFLNDNLLEKVLDVQNVSILHRLNSILIDIHVFIFNPIGVGVSNHSSIAGEYGSLVSAGTSTLTTFLAEFGVLGIFHMVFWIASILRISKHRSFIVAFATFILFMFILIKESHQTLIIMNCLIFYNSYLFKTNEEKLNESLIES